MRKRQPKPCKAFQYELSHQSNLILIGNLLDDLHQVHVHLMKLQRRYYRIYGGYVDFQRMCRHITKRKARKKPHWNALPSQVIQDVALRIHRGYQRFFKNLSERKAGITRRKVGRPHIKPRSGNRFPYVGKPITRSSPQIQFSHVHSCRLQTAREPHLYRLSR